MHFSVSPTSVITRHTPHAYSALPQDMPTKQTKSVITLDLWFNRLWQHWKVVNEIAFFICISVFTNKSNPEHACCTVPLNKTKLPCSYWRDNLFNFRFCWTCTMSQRQKVSRFRLRDSWKKLRGMKVSILCLSVKDRAKKTGSVKPLVRLWCNKGQKSSLKRLLLWK